MGGLTRGQALLRRALVGGVVLLLALACASTPAPAPRTIHVLRPGETIYRLSRHYGVTVDAIVRANDIRDVSDIPVGTRLLIPGARRPPPEGSVAVASLIPVTPGAARILPGDLDFAWPVQGRLSSRYGWRHGRHHDGIDIATRRGAPVRAAEAGRVILSGWMGDYGRVVIVKHTGDYSTVYAHNSANRVRTGAFVEKGDVLAEVGTSGNASGPHLHFEIRRSSQPQDPLRYLR